MRAALFPAIILLVAAAEPSPAPLSDRDFRQLMDEAVTVASASLQAHSRTALICVARELQPPFAATNASIRAFESVGKRGYRPSTGHVGADKFLAEAMSPKAAIAHQTIMPELPAEYLLVASKARPPECKIPHGPTKGTNAARGASAVLLSFSRPVLSSGYAYIEESEECAGLCGAEYLRVFQKQKGKWTEVAKTTLSVS